MTKKAVRLDKPVKLYPNTLQRLARHFWYTGSGHNILELADELERRPWGFVVICPEDQYHMIPVLWYS